MNVNKERIRKQSKEVAEYMAKPPKYSVEWDCPHCGNSHKWWWEDEFEAHDDGPILMMCDRCDTQTWCKGDGNGFYEPIEEERKAKFRRDLTEVNSSLDQLVTSRRMQFSMLEKLTARVDDLESLEKDLHNYVRGLETKVNTNNQLAFDAINTVTMRLIELENTVAEQGSALDNLGKRTTQTELAVWRLENGVPVAGKSKLGPQHVELAKEKERSFLDLIHGKKPPFHERIREGCQLEDMDGITLASIIRFIAVEVERMTERDMGGSFTISNVKAATKLRELADEAEISDCPYRDDEEDEEGPGWGPHGWEGEDE